MLSKEKRLNLAKDFKWVAAGKRLETKLLKIFVRLGDNQFPKVGIAVSGKSFAKANQRNKVKRIASAALESLYSAFPKNLNILLLPKKGVIEVKSGDVLLELEAILESEKIIN